LIDVPNARSSHSIPTPRGGGLSVVIVGLSCQIFFIVGLFPYIGFNPTLLGIIIACLCIAGIGFWDDHQHIPARWRLLVHFGSSAFALLGLSLWQLPILAFFGVSINTLWLLGVLYLFGLVWLLNLYNFMDGIDGIASVEAITVALSATLLLFIHGQGQGFSFLFLIFASTIAGFLVWNFPAAKIFMGDACSGFLGFSLGIFALITSSGNYPLINIWSWLILLGVFITDATFTLTKRILNKEVWYEAHASHAYQHYARKLIYQFQQQGCEHQDARTKSHRRVNLMMTLINLFWLLPLAVAATFYPYWAFLITVIAYLPLIFIAQRLKAGSA
jgi:Fuc2NAc and GlcNAc transferase